MKFPFQRKPTKKLHRFLLWNKHVYEVICNSPTVDQPTLSILFPIIEIQDSPKKFLECPHSIFTSQGREKLKLLVPLAAAYYCLMRLMTFRVSRTPYRCAIAGRSVKISSTWSATSSKIFMSRDAKSREFAVAISRFPRRHVRAPGGRRGRRR